MDLIEVGFDSVRIHIPSGNHVVILKEKQGERYLPIWIGSSEAQAIAFKVQGGVPERPIAYDLLASTLTELGTPLLRVVVTELKEQVFYARLVLKQNGRTVEVDSRPSDAIAVAVRVECPMFVSSDVLDQAGVLPPEAEEGEQAEQTEVPIDDSKLDVFRQLVNSLDLPDLPGEPGSPPDERRRRKNEPPSPPSKS